MRGSRLAALFVAVALATATSAPGRLPVGSDGAAWASAGRRFDVPRQVPQGTTLFARSLDPCPTTKQGTVRVSLAGPTHADNDAVVVRTVDAPMSSQGTWTAQLETTSNPQVGRARVGAVCPDGSSYDGVDVLVTTTGDGYWLATAEPFRRPCFCPDTVTSTMATFGEAPQAGSPDPATLEGRIVGMAPQRDTGLGYWLAAADGGVFAYGDAPFRGSAGSLPLRSPIVGIASTPTGLGYWLAAADGGVFAYGDAGFHGSAASLALRSPIVAVVSQSALGYWLVAADGGVFAFGDSRFRGSTGSIRLAAPVVGGAPTPSGDGYWLVASDGGVFAFGDATFVGSAGGTRLAAPVVAIARHDGGRSAGYWLVAGDGGVFSYGSAPFLGSCVERCRPRATTRAATVVAAAGTPATAAPPHIAGPDPDGRPAGAA